jgi:hypothetical protein
MLDAFQDQSDMSDAFQKPIRHVGYLSRPNRLVACFQDLSDMSNASQILSYMLDASKNPSDMLDVFQVSLDMFSLGRPIFYRIFLPSLS